MWIIVFCIDKCFCVAERFGVDNRFDVDKCFCVAERFGVDNRFGIV